MPIFKTVVGHPIKTKVPLKLYQLDFQLNGLKDRYEFGGEVGGQQLVGVVPAGHTVIFEKAVQHKSSDVTFERLDGKIEFQGKSYPISYFLGTSNCKISDCWKGLRYDFVLP